MIRTAYRLDRRTALRAAAGLALAGPLLVPLGRRPRAQTLDKVSIQTDWRAQAEHGGYYQAIAAGLYRKAGIECDVRQGGPSLNISQLLLAGRVDMIMSGSFEAFTYVREGAPFFTIAAIFQKDPQVLIGHPDTGFDSFEKLKGRTLLIGAGGRVTYWPYLRQKYGLSDTPAQALQLQPGAVPCRQEPDPAGLPLVRALSDRPGARPAAVGAADRRCGLQRLPGHDRDLAQDGGGEEGSRAALRRRHARGLGAVPQGRAGHRSGQRADQAGQPGADRRPHRLRHQGAGRARHRDVGRCAEGRHRRHERPSAGKVSTTRWSRSTCCPRGSTSARAYTLEFVNKGIGKP